MLVMSSRFPSTLRDDVHLGPIEQGEQLPSPNQSENQHLRQKADSAVKNHVQLHVRSYASRILLLPSYPFLFGCLPPFAKK
jgi:hypothetical protein